MIPPQLLYFESRELRVCKRAEEALINSNGSNLRVPEVHHLIEQLVNDDEIVANTFLLELFEVIFEHLSLRIQFVEPHCCW